MIKNLLFILSILFAFESFSSDFINLLKRQVKRLINGDVDTTLIIAIRNGDLKIAQFLINTGVDVNKKGACRNTPLDMAIIKDHIEIVELLLKNGAKVNELDRFDCTPLFHTILKGNWKIAKLLLAYGAKVNKPHPDIGFPIQIAILERNSEIVRILLDSGANIDNLFAESPKISIPNNIKMVELLLANGADPNKISKSMGKKIGKDIREILDKYNTLIALALSTGIKLPSIERIDKIDDLVLSKMQEGFSEGGYYIYFPNEILLLIFSNINVKKQGSNYLKLRLVSKEFYPISTKYLIFYMSLNKKILYLREHNMEFPVAITWEDVGKFAKDNGLEW